jgi:ribonucleotide monophosphatase NagD (HAD superfamily)
MYLIDYNILKVIHLQYNSPSSKFIFNLKSKMSSNFLLTPFRWLFPNTIRSLIKRPTKENIKDYELLIFSLDGVLTDNTNCKSMPLAVETFNKLKSLGFRICIITNECRYSPKRVRKDLLMLNFEIDNTIDIITASSLTLISLTNILKWKHVSNSSNLNKDTENFSSKYISRKRYKTILNDMSNTTTPVVSSTKFGIIGSIDLFNYLRNSICKKYRNVHFFSINDDDIHPPKNLDYIIIGSINNNSELNKLITNSVRWFQENPKTSIILSHSDIVAEHRNNNQFIYPLSLVNMIEKSGQLQDSQFKIPEDKIAVGKPYCSEFIDKFIQRYNLIENNKLKVLMIGDDYNSDMKFAENANCDKCLVLSGNTQIKDIEQNNIDISNIEYIIPDVSYIGL